MRLFFYGEKHMNTILKLAEAGHLLIIEIVVNENFLSKATICFKQDLTTKVKIIDGKFGKYIYVDERTNIVYDAIVKDAGDYIYMINTECLKKHSI